MKKPLEIQVSIRSLLAYGATFIAAAVLFIGSSYLFAATPNPGHPWTDIGNGTWQVANTQTAVRTFTFPDADATVLTTASASTTLLSLYNTLYVGATATTTISSAAINIPTGGTFQINGTNVLTGSALGAGITSSSLTSLGTLTSLTVSGQTNLGQASSTQDSNFGTAYFGGTATSTFNSAGVLTLASALALASGGTNASLSASNGGIVWSNASQLQILGGTATAGQVLQSGANATPSWSTATYPATAGAAGNVLMSNGSNWVSTATSSSFIGTQVLTSGTTYTPSAGTQRVVVVLIAGGGGGGGASGASSSVGAAGGGGAGGVCQKAFSGVSGTYTVAVGGAGTAGANTGANGGPGGSTTLTNGATTYTANGGSGGTGQTAGTAQAVVAGGAGGVISTNCDVNGGGQPGEVGYRVSGAFGWSGNGGSDVYGGGGLGLIAAAAGNNATGFGGGGGGALSTANSSKAGGAGTAGAIIVYEYR